MHEIELIHRILAGNKQDFKQLIKKYEKNVFRTAIGFIHNKEDAEDITQDVFVKVYQSLSSFNGKSAFSTWLYRITINTSLNYLRKKKRRNIWVELSDFLLQVPSNDMPIEVAISESSDRATIQLAIDHLPAKQRQAFVLTRYEDLPQRQVAEIMKISVGAVEQLLLRAQNNLKNKLDKELDRPYVF